MSHPLITIPTIKGFEIRSIGRLDLRDQRSFCQGRAGMRKLISKTSSYSRWACAGILVPDLCLEETDIMQSATKKAGLELTQLVTPTTPQERMKRIAAVSEGFVYLVSVTGDSLLTSRAHSISKFGLTYRKMKIYWICMTLIASTVCFHLLHFRRHEAVL